MTATISASEILVYKGIFRYVTKDKKLTPNPHLYHLPPLSAFNSVLTLPLTDLRPSLSQGHASEYTLDYHGFTARHEPSRLHSKPHSRESWNDPDMVQSIYMPEVAQMIKRITGCKTAIVESAVLRNNVHSEVDSHAQEHSAADLAPDDAGPCPRMIGFSSAGGAPPAPKVHLDFSPTGARTHIRKYHRSLALAAQPVIEAENKLLQSGTKWSELKDHYQGTQNAGGGVPRFSLYSVWRSLRTVRRDPLAVSSCASFPVSDYVAVDLVQPSGGQIPAHLARSIDPEHPEALTDAMDRGNATHFSGSYLAYAPSDKEQKAHDWHFISDQDPEDVLIIQLFDNDMEARTGASKSASDLSVSGVIHSAFELEGQDYAGPARESIEVRVLALW